LLLPFAIHAIGPRRKTAAPAKAHKTLDVMPLPTPQFVARETPMPMVSMAMPMAVTTDDDDIEGKTMRAPMSNEEAYEMHARYAPAFDQQAAIARYRAQYGEDQHEPAAPQHDPALAFDQRTYAAALEYANAFESQLMRTRRTAAYEVAAPRRIARGSFTPHQYQAVDRRSDQLAISPSDWDAKTLIGVHPLKPGK
jgi:hypothetical protein